MLSLWVVCWQARLPFPPVWRYAALPVSRRAFRDRGACRRLSGVSAGGLVHASPGICPAHSVGDLAAFTEAAADAVQRPPLPYRRVSVTRRGKTRKSTMDVCLLDPIVDKGYNIKV